MSFPGSRYGATAGKREPAREASGSLAEFIRLQASRRGLRLPRSGAALLAGLDYDVELQLKNGALADFWKHHELPGRPQAIVSSPLPRHYRTTSKRRVPDADTGDRRGSKSRRIFSEGDDAALLEPREHASIFAAVGDRLRLPEFEPLARSLNFVIIRGTYEEFQVIFNLHAMNREVNRLLLKAVTALRELEANVISAFLYLDPSRSPYYLETDRPRGPFPIKKLFGPECFRLRLGDLTFTVPPLAFSQVNESLLPLLLGNVGEALAGEGRERLLDLYCGYGLFTLSLRPRYREIIAVDAAPASIRAGSSMLPSAPGRARVNFKVHSIDRDSLSKALPPPLAPGAEDVILDPPRRGADAAVIRSIARRRPGRVLHLFCASEEMPGAIGLWRRSGYLVRRIVPMDMFAGTPQLETLVLLSLP
jgi:tRNA/tmRNA/rRNA uracil-C5-methylase (TrmA/RlmC/RlmD family)